jgi:hypothetical protein
MKNKTKNFAVLGVMSQRNMCMAAGRKHSRGLSMASKYLSA